MLGADLVYRYEFRSRKHGLGYGYTGHGDPTIIKKSWIQDKAKKKYFFSFICMNRICMCQALTTSFIINK